MGFRKGPCREGPGCISVLAVPAVLVLLVALADAAPARFSDGASYYEVLGVQRTATAKEIRQAYRQLSLIHHPDKSESGDATNFLKIAEAYEVLSDEDKRAAYDRAGHRAYRSTAGEHGGGHRTMTEEEARRRLEEFMKDFLKNIDDFDVSEYIDMMGEPNPRKQSWGEYFFKKGAKLLARQFEQPVKEFLKTANWEVRVGGQTMKMNSGQWQQVGDRSGPRPRKPKHASSNSRAEF